jgi:hypothetical protein
MRAWAQFQRAGKVITFDFYQSSPERVCHDIGNYLQSILILSKDVIVIAVLPETHPGGPDMGVPGLLFPHIEHSPDIARFRRRVEQQIDVIRHEAVRRNVK